MEITVTTKHKISFAVEYFENSVGGMVSGQFGNTVHTLEKAIDLLGQAKRVDVGPDWVIVVDIDTKIS